MNLAYVPIRVERDSLKVATGPVYTLTPDHPACCLDCPVCEEPLGDQPVVTAIIGADPEQWRTQWMTVTTVLVHQACAQGPASTASSRP